MLSTYIGQNTRRHGDCLKVICRWFSRLFQSTERNGKMTGKVLSGKNKGNVQLSAVISVAVFMAASTLSNVTDIAKVSLSVKGVSLADARCHLTDRVRTYTEVPLCFEND